MTSRLLSESTSGWVATQRIGGGKSPVLMGPDPLNQNTRPSGLTNACRPRSVRDSTRTARIDRTSTASCRSGRASSCSKRAVSTVAGSDSSRTTSIRKTAFRVFDSTMVRWVRPWPRASGTAGDPLPEPMSISRTGPGGRKRTADSGSMSRRSRLRSSSGSSFSPVRLMREFQRTRRRK